MPLVDRQLSAIKLFDSQLAHSLYCIPQLSRFLLGRVVFQSRIGN